MMKSLDKQIAYLENHLHIAKVNLKHSHEEIYLDYFREQVLILEAILETIKKEKLND